MKRELIIIILLSLMLPVSVSAQRGKRKPKAKVVQVEEPVENPIFTKMLPTTAKVIIIDSMLVEKANLLRTIPVNQEEGRLVDYAQFFKKSDNEGIVYVNELGNKCIFPKTVDANGNKRLFQSDLLGNSWTEPTELLGLDDNGLVDYDYPYLMPDGVTLYFSARGEESLGGYDIYRTRFDSETGRFLKPENLGLPFNSEQDDYMFVIDEQNQLAYFTSSRHQHKDTLCLYTFIPFETRIILNASNYSPSQIRSLARIDRISDTWGDGAERKEATKRRSNIYAGHSVSAIQQSFSFIVNDKKTYIHMRDFRKQENRDRMKELLAMQKQDRSLVASLEKIRKEYSTASAAERERLRTGILESENQHRLLLVSMKKLEKEIRNTEFK